MIVTGVNNLRTEADLLVLRDDELDEVVKAWTSAQEEAGKLSDLLTENDWFILEAIFNFEDEVCDLLGLQRDSSDDPGINSLIPEGCQLVLG